MVRIAINGYGRIGRNVHRQLVERFADSVEVVAVNASSTSEMRAYLLRYDSLHGRFDGAITVDSDEQFSVRGMPVRVVRERDPSLCPWRDLDVDIVIESTGKFTTKEKAQQHLHAGARKVVVTAPMKDDTPTFVLGVNDDLLDPSMDVISNASCTTNCIAPVIKAMDDAYGVERLLVSSVHAFTATQNLLDNKPQESGELRKARAATLSMIPTKTGAVKACGDIFPHLKGKLDGMAFRVPVPTVSCAYMAFTLREETTADAINRMLSDAAATARLSGILEVSHDQCVSIDFQTDPHSSIVDAPSTKVIAGTSAQVLSWYDNEWGYAMRVIELTKLLADMLT